MFGVLWPVIWGFLKDQTRASSTASSHWAFRSLWAEERITYLKVLCWALSSEVIKLSCAGDTGSHPLAAQEVLGRQAQRGVREPGLRKVPDSTWSVL